MHPTPSRPGESDMEEQCANLSTCAERLASIIETHPNRNDLRALHALMENALGNIRGSRSV